MKKKNRRTIFSAEKRGVTHIVFLVWKVETNLNLNESEFWDTSKDINWEKFDRWVSLMTPFNLFDERNNFWRPESWPTVCGIGPLNLLLERYNAFKEASLANSNNGCDPFNWLKLRSRNERDDKWTSDFGNGPTTLVFRRDNVSKNGNMKNREVASHWMGYGLVSKSSNMFLGNRFVVCCNQVCQTIDLILRVTLEIETYS